jgi:hypothetical protein
MGTCSVTCQANRNHHPVSDKHKQDENLRHFKSNVNNVTKPSYVTGLEEYHDPISYTPSKARPPPQPPPLPDCGNANRSISPISMIKPIRRRNTVTSIQDEREMLASERREFERDKQVHKIQETFKDAYRNSVVRTSRTERKKNET